MFNLSSDHVSLGLQQWLRRMCILPPYSTCISAVSTFSVKAPDIDSYDISFGWNQCNMQLMVTKGLEDPVSWNCSQIEDNMQA